MSGEYRRDGVRYSEVPDDRRAGPGRRADDFMIGQLVAEVAAIKESQARTEHSLHQLHAELAELRTNRDRALGHWGGAVAVLSVAGSIVAFVAAAVWQWVMHGQ